MRDAPRSKGSKKLRGASLASSAFPKVAFPFSSALKKQLEKFTGPQTAVAAQWEKAYTKNPA